MAQPSVIIASSGMLNGALAFTMPKLYWRSNAAILLADTLTRKALVVYSRTRKTGDEVELDGHKLTVRARKRFNLSAHADKLGLTQVIAKVNP